MDQIYLWLKFRVVSYGIYGTNHIWFWSLGSQESNARNGSQIESETSEMWPIKGTGIG